jgi:hypothetical protein
MLCYPDNPPLHANAVLSNYYDQNWYLDSGASSHITSQQGSLALENNTILGQNISTADGASHQVAGIGSTTVSSHSGSINLKRVFYVPVLTRNLISVGSLTDDGNMVLFTKKKCLIFQDDISQTILATGTRDLINGLYKFGPTSSFQTTVNQITTSPHNSNISSKPTDIQLWHLRYGHLHYAGLYLLSQKEKVRGLPLFKMSHEICSDCMAGRQHRERFPKATSHRASQVLELIHTNLVGPLKVPSLSGSRYFIVFTDDFTRKSWVYFLKPKGEAFQKFQEFKLRVEKEIGKHIIILHSD